MSIRIESRRPATYEDLLRVPEHLVAEIIDGELYTSPRPAPRYANTSSVLGGELVGPFHRGRGGPGGWWILFEPELHLEKQVLVPDFGGWRRERMPALPDTAWFPLAPDWVCEVVSPGSGRHDRVRKMPRYAEFGVSHLWLIDPNERTVEIYRLGESRWLLAGGYGGDDKMRAEPFEAVEIELEALWA